MKTYILANPMASQRTSQSASDHQAASGAACPPKKVRVIYLGVDVHLHEQVVCRKLDGAAPQPAQRFTPTEFQLWVVKQQTLAEKVVCCYEAGPFGYTLQRHLERTGVECLVVRPQNWDQYGSRVKTDGRDACALVEGLARYVEGDNKALAVVRVPQGEQEQHRALSRHREDLVREVRRIGAQGRGRALTQGVELGRHWWRPKVWEAWLKQLPQWLVAILDCLREVLMTLERGIARCTKQIEALAGPAMRRPKGLGELSERIINNEVLDWQRFNNRRQVSSYTGLCPSEHSSGGSRRLGSINKHGNRRLRTALVEAAWRMARFQPGWKRLQKVKEKQHLTLNGKRPSLKKKITVELARGLAVDLWRLNTGRATLADLGLEPGQ